MSQPDCEELKLCPFCASKAEYDDKFADLGDMFEGCIICSNDECYAQPYVCGLGGYEYLANKWNTRAEQPTIKTFEDLAELLKQKTYRFNNGVDLFITGYIKDKDYIYNTHKEFYIQHSKWDNITPQQAHNIITTLKDNLGG